MVVVAGETVMLPDAATGLPFNKTWEALLIPHCRVLLPPCVMVDGEALNGLVIDGQGGAVTVTVTN